MKKLIPFALAAAVALPIFAVEKDVDEIDRENKAEAQPVAAPVEKKIESATWPAFFAVGQIPHSCDVIGLRLTIPYSTSQENVTGIDLGLWGSSLSFEGLQVNVLRNVVVDDAAGIQLGIYNTIGNGDMLGLQAGLWNEAMCLRGVQLGLLNVANEAEGFQFGLINRADTFSGYQVGLINVIRSNEIQFFPILNIGF